MPGNEPKKHPRAGRARGGGKTEGSESTPAKPRRQAPPKIQPPKDPVLRALWQARGTNLPPRHQLALLMLARYLRRGDREIGAPCLPAAPPDGLEPPNRLRLNGKLYDLPPIPWKLLHFILTCEGETACITDAVEAAWGHDASDGAFKKAVYDLNRKLEEIGAPYSVSTKQGYVILDRYPT